MCGGPFVQLVGLKGRRMKVGDDTHAGTPGSGLNLLEAGGI